MSTVSVIVPNYNHSSYLKQRIDSILNQTYQDFELILLDDCSTDNSREILSEYINHPKVSHCVFNTENSGSTFRQWDKGIELAKGEFIWIAESDDWAEKEFLETVINAFQRNPQVGLVYTGSKLVDCNGQITFYNDCENSEGEIHYKGIQFIRKKLACSNAIWNASMMVFKRYNYPTENKSLFLNMKYCGDWFFYVLVAEQCNVIEIRKALNNFRVHEQNVSTQAEKSGKSFTEGLIVYNFLKSYLTTKDYLLSTKEWGKSLYKYKQKYNVKSDLWRELIKEISRENKQILLSYGISSIFKTLTK